MGQNGFFQGHLRDSHCGWSIRDQWRSRAGEQRPSAQALWVEFRHSPKGTVEPLGDGR